MNPRDVAVVAADVAVAGALGWWFFGRKKTAAAALSDGVQEARVTVRGGYSPNRIRPKVGVPLRIVFDRKETGDCTARVVFPDVGAVPNLLAFAQATLELTPTAAGEYGFACGMNMIISSLSPLFLCRPFAAVPAGPDRRGAATGPSAGGACSGGPS